MTERLYYTDSFCRVFDAVVTRALDHEGRPAVVLDRTAFYPTSGGQPFDTGRLGPADVIDTVDAGDEILHVVSTPLSPGTQVRGEIDWPRRFDHMQQHTGQHVLSAVFDRLLDNRTVSFHMGEATSTIDLAREASPADIDRAVDEANRIVWDDCLVRVRFASPEEAARLPLRKESVRTGMLRLVEIGEVDLSACGGTHVARTGTIGIIAVSATERIRGGTRITFVCGGRVARMFAGYRDAIAGSVRVLSVLPRELPDAIERQQLDTRELRKAVGRLQARLAGYEASRLLAEARQGRDARVIVVELDDWDQAGLKAIASALARESRVAAALFTAARPAAAVVTCSAGLDVDASTVLRGLLDRFGGRGGGKADLAQGAGLTGSSEELLAAARDLLALKRS